MSILQHPDAVTIGGRFGWALTGALARRHPGWRFLFIMRDHKKVQEATRTRQVDQFFGGKIAASRSNGLKLKIRMPDNVRFHSLDDFNAHFRGQIKRVFIPGVPSSRMRSVMNTMLDHGVPKEAFARCETLSVSKGMEAASMKFPHEIIDDLLHTQSVVALGGNLAFDFAAGDPMLMELAGYRSNTRRTSSFFTGTPLIIYETRNRRKLSLAGPMKNIHSLATGMTSVPFGSSSVSTVATMGLSEYERAAFIVQFRKNLQPLARRLQKLPFHFRSVPIAGGAMSDYHLFAFTRNYSAGQAFVKEMKKSSTAARAMAVISRGCTIESFASAAPTRDYLNGMGCFSPVIETVADILEDRVSPEKGIQQLIRQKNLIPT